MQKLSEMLRCLDEYFEQPPRAPGGFVSRPKRFGDMEMTKEQAYGLVAERNRTRVVPYEPLARQRIEERAASLLPLWRTLGLRQLRYDGWVDGHNHATTRRSQESPF